MSFLTSLLVSGIFFLSASLIFLSKSDSPVLYLVFKTNPIALMSFTFATNLPYTAFLTISLLTTFISLLKSTGAVFNLSTTILSISAFKLTK